MREFIKDAFLLRVLDEIESTHGKPVLTEHAPPEARGNRPFGMRYDTPSDSFVFSYFPDNPPSQVNVCHEMLHCCLMLEGWPNRQWPIGLDRLVGAALNVS